MHMEQVYKLWKNVRNKLVLEYLALVSQWKLFIVIWKRKLKSFEIPYEYSLLFWSNHISVLSATLQ